MPEVKDVKTDEKEEVVTRPVDEKKLKEVVEIIRGRMPLPIVKLIKFNTDGETDGAVAAKFRTTNGKVSDIRKNRNFLYVDKDFRPSADQKKMAEEYAAQLNNATILQQVKDMPVGDDTDAAKLAEARKKKPAGDDTAKPKEKPAAKPAEKPAAKPAEKPAAADTAKPAANATVTPGTKVPKSEIDSLTK